MSITFTEREQKLMAFACQCFESEPKLDIDKFAQRAGLTVGSARNAWAALKKKLYAQDGTPTKTPGTKSTKKRPPPVLLPANDNGSDDEEVPTPSKKPKTPVTKAKAKAKGKGKAKTIKSEDEEDDDDFVKVKSEVADDDYEEI